MNKGSRRAFRPVLWSLSIQMLTLALICTPLYFIDKRLVQSAAVGGLIFIIPNAYFAYYALRFRGASQAILIAKSSYQGLMGKLALSAAGFAIIFSIFKELQVFTVLLVYFLMVLLQVLLAKKVSDDLASYCK